MNGAAIPLVMVAMVLLFGGKKKKTTGKKKPDYKEDDREKRDPTKKKKPTNTDTDEDLEDDDHDPKFFDEECGPGWVFRGGECVWLSDYEAPDVPPDGVWIAPDCGVVVVGKDWWEDVAIPLIEEYVDDGEGYSHRYPDSLAVNDPDGVGTVLDYDYDWWSTAQGLAYQILLPYDMGPVNDTTGMRDTNEVCLDVFPMITYDFEWYTHRPRAEDFVDMVEGEPPDSPNWDAWHAAKDAWEQNYLGYLEAIEEKMPGLDLLYRSLVATIEAHYLDVYGDNG